MGSSTSEGSVTSLLEDARIGNPNREFCRTGLGRFGLGGSGGAAVSGAASGAVVPRPLMGVARLASMVTVVDGVNFLKDLCERGDLTLDEIGAGLGSFAMQQHGDDPKGAQGAEEGEGDERPLANLLMEQVTGGAALWAALVWSLACRQAQPLPATHASSFLSFFLFFF
mmetsp:Transcript_17492/g.40233  ORF Transcript_17492/g.40233 Transcript_17492/m.40233 type:complete len:169 (-) Transcript_17492:1327-1833(-)